MAPWNNKDKLNADESNDNINYKPTIELTPSSDLRDTPSSSTLRREALHYLNEHDNPRELSRVSSRTIRYSQIDEENNNISLELSSKPADNITMDYFEHFNYRMRSGAVANVENRVRNYYEDNDSYNSGGQTIKNSRVSEGDLNTMSVDDVYSHPMEDGFGMGSGMEMGTEVGSKVGHGMNGEMGKSPSMSTGMSQGMWPEMGQDMWPGMGHDMGMEMATGSMQGTASAMSWNGMEVEVEQGIGTGIDPKVSTRRGLEMNSGESPGLGKEMAQGMVYGDVEGMNNNPYNYYGYDSQRIQAAEAQYLSTLPPNFISSAQYQTEPYYNYEQSGPGNYANFPSLAGGGIQSPSPESGVPAKSAYASESQDSCTCSNCPGNTGQYSNGNANFQPDSAANFNDAPSDANFSNSSYYNQSDMSSSFEMPPSQSVPQCQVGHSASDSRHTLLAMATAHQRNMMPGASPTNYRSSEQSSSSSCGCPIACEACQQGAQMPYYTQSTPYYAPVQSCFPSNPQSSSPFQGMGMGMGMGMPQTCCECDNQVPQTVYATDYKPCAVRGNIFNHFPKSESSDDSAGCSGYGACVCCMTRKASNGAAPAQAPYSNYICDPCGMPAMCYSPCPCPCPPCPCSSGPGGCCMMYEMPPMMPAQNCFCGSPMPCTAPCNAGTSMQFVPSPNSSDTARSPYGNCICQATSCNLSNCSSLS